MQSIALLLFAHVGSGFYAKFYYQMFIICNKSCCGFYFDHMFSVSFLVRSVTSGLVFTGPEPGFRFQFANDNKNLDIWIFELFWRFTKI